MGIEAAEKEGEASTDESHLLALPQNFQENLLLTVDHDQLGFRLEDLPQHVAVTILVLDEPLHHHLHLADRTCSRCPPEDLLKSHHGVIVLVEDGDGGPPVGLQQVQVGAAQASYVRVKIDGVFSTPVQYIPWPIVPPSFDVGNLHAVRDHPHMLRARHRERPEDGDHPTLQLVADLPLR